MKHFVLIFTLLFFGVSVAYAQRTLVMQEETDSEESFTMEGMAGVIIRCDKELAIRSFVSNMDAQVRLEQTIYDDENQEAYHCLVFPSGKRILTIKADTYYAFDLDLDVMAGRMYRYHIYDMDRAATASYFDQHTKRGQSYFDGCDYVSAREEFTHARDWSEATPTNVEEATRLIANCDTLLHYRRLAYDAADCLDFDNAINYLSIAMKLNPQDHNLISKFDECYAAQQERCETYLAAGDAFFKDKEYADAILMYKKVEERTCDGITTALKQRIEAERLLKRRKNLDRYIGLEYSSNKVFGFTSATYKKTGGGYFTLRTNSDFFDLISSKAEMSKHAELNMNFGWTIPVITLPEEKIFRGAWLHVGIGAVGVNRYKADDEAHCESGDVYVKSDLWTDSGLPSTITDIQQEHLNQFIGLWNGSHPTNERIDINDLVKPEFGVAATPEVGFVVKIWRVALRATYQYRFSFNNEFNDVLGKNRFYFGLGFCW